MSISHNHRYYPEINWAFVATAHPKFDQLIPRSSESRSNSFPLSPLPCKIEFATTVYAFVFPPRLLSRFAWNRSLSGATLHYVKRSAFVHARGIVPCRSDFHPGKELALLSSQDNDCVAAGNRMEVLRDLPAERRTQRYVHAMYDRIYFLVNHGWPLLCSPSISLSLFSPPAPPLLLVLRTMNTMRHVVVDKTRAKQCARRKRRKLDSSERTRGR